MECTQSTVSQTSPRLRHSKRECSEAERVIWNPAFSQRIQLVAAKAGFQIAHFAALRFAFGKTDCHGHTKNKCIAIFSMTDRMVKSVCNFSLGPLGPGEYPAGGRGCCNQLIISSPLKHPLPASPYSPGQGAEGETLTPTLLRATKTLKHFNR